MFYNTNQQVGVIVNCMMTHIYADPDEDSAIIFCVTCLSEVMVELQFCDDEFYKVCTACGVEGYCKKKFVAIREED